MRLSEQADRGREGFVYSWILDAPYSMRNRLPGWKWIPGYRCRGSFVTNDRTLAIATAERFNLSVGSNGTHKVLQAPQEFCHESRLA
jgi:hypothetical protein